MGQARKTTDTKYKEALANANNILIDSVGGSSKVLLKKKQELEDLGYSTAMIVAYVSPITSLERNKQRDRSLLPSIVLRSWRDVNKNINVYKQAFEGGVFGSLPGSLHLRFGVALLLRLCFTLSAQPGSLLFGCSSGSCRLCFGFEPRRLLCFVTPPVPLSMLLWSNLRLRRRSPRSLRRWLRYQLLPRASLHGSTPPRIRGAWLLNLPRASVHFSTPPRIRFGYLGG